MPPPPPILAGLQERAHRPGGPSLAADHLAEVVGSDLELQDAAPAPARDLLDRHLGPARALLDLHLVRLVHQQTGKLLEIVGELGHVQALFFLVWLISRLTVGEIWAPLPIQWSARAVSIVTCAGCLVGS